MQNVSRKALCYDRYNVIELRHCRWIEACIEEELPITTELEENLQNGVILAKLGHFFAPKVVPIRRIYDKDLTRFKVS